MKRFIALALTFIMIFSLSACGKGTDSESGEKTNSSKNSFDMKDIDWAVEEGIKDGDRVMTFNITNNSKYTIKEIEISFVEKSSVTEEQRNAFWATLKTLIASYYDDIDSEIEKMKVEYPTIEMYCNCDSIINSGETNNTGRLYYFHGILYCNDSASYDLVEPDIATIEYADGDVIKTVYYDFTTEKYTEDSETEVAYQWSEFALGQSLPKPDVKILSSSCDYEDRFAFYAYGATRDMYKQYVEDCKALGYTQDVYTHDDYYRASNANGGEVTIDYDDGDKELYVSIDAGDTTEEEVTEDVDG